MPAIGRIMLRGLAVLLPIVAALAVLVWLFNAIDEGVRWLLPASVPAGLYATGVGVLLALALVFVTGLAMYTWIARALAGLLDRSLRRIPIFSSIYSPTKDLFDIMQGQFSDQLGQAVLVQLPGSDLRVLGFVTRRDTDGLPGGFPPDHVVVFVQMSYQIGGFSVVVPADRVQQVEMSAEEGLRWAVTAGLSAPVRAADAQSQTPQADAAGSG
ncbi:MAG: DUF502 domain-containing protein [Planctomycetota bacterium]